MIHFLFGLLGCLSQWRSKIGVNGPQKKCLNPQSTSARRKDGLGGLVVFVHFFSSILFNSYVSRAVQNLWCLRYWDSQIIIKLSNPKTIGWFRSSGVFLCSPWSWINWTFRRYRPTQKGYHLFIRSWKVFLSHQKSGLSLSDSCLNLSRANLIIKDDMVYVKANLRSKFLDLTSSEFCELLSEIFGILSSKYDQDFAIKLYFLRTSRLKTFENYEQPKIIPWYHSE